MKEGKRASFFGKVSTFSQVVSQKVDAAKDAAGNIRVPGLSRGKCYTLLVIDDANTDWSKYFRGRRLHGGEYDVKVEQAEFKELSVAATVDGGVLASVKTPGNKVVRTFKPDFTLIRQNVRDAPHEDYKNILLGFQYGNVPSVNSLESIYNFQDKPWVYGHLIEIQRKLGKENFPLVNQSYYPNHHELSSSPKFPCVFKVGHAHGGQGKVKVENEARFQDMTSVVAVSNTYCTVEPYIDSKFDLHVQKIGGNYKTLMRKSLSGNWKTNIGQSILEEISVSDKHKAWVDAVSELFGGLGICSLEAVVGKDGKEYIIEVNDCATTLLGESQEEDRKNIADLVISQMEEKCKPDPPSDGEEEAREAEPGAAATSTPLSSSGSKPGALASAARQVSRGSLLGGGDGSKPSMASTVLAYASKATSKVSGGQVPEKPTEDKAKPPLSEKPSQEAAKSATAAKKEEEPPKPSGSAASAPPPKPDPPPSKPTPPPPPTKPETSSANRKRHDSQDSTDSSASEESTVSGVSSASSTVKKVDITASKKEATASKTDDKGAPSNGATGENEGDEVVEGEDTMKNLRKTFAGIFGDM